MDGVGGPSLVLSDNSRLDHVNLVLGTISQTSDALVVLNADTRSVALENVSFTLLSVIPRQAVFIDASLAKATLSLKQVYYNNMTNSVTAGVVVQVGCRSLDYD